MKIRTVAAGSMVGLLALVGCSQAPSSPSAVPTTSAPTDQVTLYVVRHGKTMLNTTDRVQGWADAPLTPDGEKVVKAAGCGLKDVAFQAAYSSDSGRAVQTAELILGENAAAKELTLNHDARLREFNFGTWEGDLNHTMWSAIAEDQGITLEEFQNTLTPEGFANSVAKLDAANPEAAKNWAAEDYPTITKRLKEGLDEIVAKESAAGHQNVLLVSHGLSISALFDTVTADFAIPAGGLKNASVSILKYEKGAYSLESLNLDPPMLIRR